MQLIDKHILLGISGGIAAYKSAELVRRLREHSAQVRVVMTEAATQFVSPLTFQALSGEQVHTTLLDPQAEATMGHITLARWADLIVIAPATADIIARLTHGLADDLLTTLCLASQAPIFLAPAMNQQMWQAPATQHNCKQLRQRGIVLLGPASGEQACGEQGMGRMLEAADIITELQMHLAPKHLATKHVVITAGPTREPIDPVRFISNRSSGQMGYALAAAAINYGASVTLISGPVCLNPPPQVTIHRVETAAQMLKAVKSIIDTADIFIGCAAVADYRPDNPNIQKIKKQQQALQIPLEPTEDILDYVTRLSNPPFTVGFAAETHDLRRYALEKMQRKRLDMIAANLVGEGRGFETRDNALMVFSSGKEVSLPQANKSELAQQLLVLIAQNYIE